MRNLHEDACLAIHLSTRSKPGVPLFQKWWSGALIGWLFLALCVAWAWSDSVFSDPNGWGPGKLSSNLAFGSTFWLRAAYVGGAVLLLHATFGLAVWLYARLICRGSPVLQMHPACTLWSCWVLIGTWVVMSNMTWYPASVFSSIDSILTREYAWFVPAEWLALGLSLAAACAALRVLSSTAIRTLFRRQPARRTLVASVAIAAIFAIGWFVRLPTANVGTGSSAQPNIILIGLDSLRNDLPGGQTSDSLTPQLDAFLKESARFGDTTTPLARTFGSWIAILTGRHPVATNARVNLMPRRLISEGATLPKLLKARGYSTLYATDEVRFANIDQTYGFDRLITPPIGASDFLLGKINDLPLSNLVSPSWVARWLFPHSWANRAVYHTYRSTHFTTRLRQELGASSPVFAAIHLTLAHWPYNRAGQPLTRSRPLEIRSAYRKAVREMDGQFGDVLAILEQRGLLKNALVVVLSDHGEAMGKPEDSLLRDVQRIEERWGSMWGHGTSVMSPHQYQVLLAFRGYGPSELPAARGYLTVPASLEDIAPTVAEIIGLAADAATFDGISLYPVLSGDDEATRPVSSRIRFTETDFNTNSILRGKFDERSALAEAGVFYEVDPASGWVQLKTERLPEIYSRKERAAISARQILAALPTGKGDHQYFMSDRQAPVPKRLQARPDPLASPEEARLWDALHARFPGELADPSGLP